MALSWATIQVLAAVPSLPKGDKKNLPYRLHWEAFPSCFPRFSPSLVCKQSLASSCTHLTPQSIGQGSFCSGGNKQGFHVTEKSNTIVVLTSFPLFLSRVPHSVSPHTPLSCPLLWLFFYECRGQSLGIFTLLLLLSTLVTETTRAHRKESYADKGGD